MSEATGLESYNPRLFPMGHDAKSEVTRRLRSALASVAPEAGDVTISLERPRDPSHGDLATNLAMVLAKRLKQNPRRIGESLAAALHALPVDGSSVIESVEIAGAGFLNLRLTAAAKLEGVRRALAEGPAYGTTRTPDAQTIQIEFVSANPTGPLHVGHGRQAALGDALAAILVTQGHRVTREFYYNDAGAQIANLARSVQARAQGLNPGDAAWPADAYNGEYIAEIAAAFCAKKTVSSADAGAVTATGEIGDLEAIRRFAVACLRNEQDADLRAFGVAFDVFFLESSLYAEGKVDEVVRALVASGRTEEKDGALWLKTTAYGDDKDRVVRKSDGSYTYFVPDVAYHVSKWRRGFRKVINIQGTDHHSTVTRVRAGLQAIGIGIPGGWPDYVLHSLVKVVREGAEVKISKRAGSYVTLRDLIDWVGRDAVRFFLVSRRADSEFVFDVDLARSKSEENPVYYVQYAHARVCSVFAQRAGAAHGADAAVQAPVGSGAANSAPVDPARLTPLATPREFALAMRIAEYPEVIRTAADELSPHLVAFYLRELAAEFHGYYNSERILVEDAATREARLALCAATRQVLRNGLSLLGVSAPEKM